jgi:quercetin dioxygenase-like cupin family protein
VAVQPIRESPRLTPQTASSTTVYVVAGGNHVAIVLDRSQSNELLDVIEVRAAPGGGPPPHRHAFAEWFRVLEGELTFAEERDGVMRATHASAPEARCSSLPGPTTAP